MSVILVPVPLYVDCAEPSPIARVQAPLMGARELPNISYDSRSTKCNYEVCYSAGAQVQASTRGGDRTGTSHPWAEDSGVDHGNNSAFGKECHCDMHFGASGTLIGHGYLCHF